MTVYAKSIVQTVVLGHIVYSSVNTLYDINAISGVWVDVYEDSILLLREDDGLVEGWSKL
jgi:hypothetical protein